MSFADFDPGWGLWALAAYSFLVATLLPGSSELALLALVEAAPELKMAAWTASTVGNTLGGLFTWGCGRYLPRWQRLTDLPWQAPLQRWGSGLLLFAWVPLIGDALCLAAGWLRLNWLNCLLFMAIGKGARYGLLLQAITSG